MLVSSKLALDGEAIMVTREDEKVMVERLDRCQLQERLRGLQERRASSAGGGDQSIDAVVSREVLEDDISDLQWLLASAP